MSKNASLLQRVADAIDEVHTAFGAPGGYGYETTKGKALFGLYRLIHSVEAARKEQVASDAPLEDRLAECLAAAVDTTLLTVRDTLNDYPVELRLGSFNREISERAAALLEEAGR
ncbi:MAG: hypothetical protein ACREDO_04635 [Methyloceanibacter sp.]